MTNLALFVSVYPDLLEGVEEFVFMGGGVGMGNRSAAAEFNILCDRAFPLYLWNVSWAQMLPTSARYPDSAQCASSDRHDAHQCNPHRNRDERDSRTASRPGSHS